MNFLLHGLDAPQIDPGNALRFKLPDIGEKDRVDVILTNPPFGGEEEKGIHGNFPEDKQTAETALLFLQLIMRKLRRASRAGLPPARAAVVVPNGVLFGDGVCGRIKQELLSGRTRMPKLNRKQFFAFQFTHPTIPDKRRIVAEIDALQVVVDALKRFQAETGTEFDALLPAILDRAFKGEL